MLTNLMNIGDFKNTFKQQHPVIDDGIISRLVFRHYKLAGKDAKKKAMYITADNELLPGKVQMEVRDYTLMVRYKGLKMKDGKKMEKGDTRMEDITCYSDYMPNVLPRVGKVSVDCCIASLIVNYCVIPLIDCCDNAICEHYDWVAPEDEIFTLLGQHWRPRQKGDCGKMCC